jgi:TonB family protein
MTFRSLVAAAALVLPACAATGQELAPTTAHHAVPKLALAPQRLSFPALAGAADLPSADAIAMHMEKVLGDSAQADVKICVDGAGAVESASILKSSGMSAYDAAVLGDVKAWRFEAPTGADHCTTATIVYTLR